MRKRSSVAMLASLACTGLLAAGCEEKIDDHRPASSVVDDHGFAHDRRRALALDGREIRLWGYVDAWNVVPETVGERIPAGAQALLKGSSRRGVSRFDLMTRPDGRAGSGIPVYLPRDERSSRLLAAIAASREAGRPTRVLVTGRVFSFDAPTNLSLLTGLGLVVKSSGDVLLDPSFRD